MKRKIRLLIFILPVFILAAFSPIVNTNADWQSSDCSSSGNAYDAYNGEQGCPYSYDFSQYVSCTLYDVDLDRNTPQIEHYVDFYNFEAWYTSSGNIEMIPKEGYGGPGFIATLNVRVFFDSGNSYEDEWWTCNVTAGTPPYPDPCW